MGLLVKGTGIVAASLRGVNYGFLVTLRVFPGVH